MFTRNAIIREYFRLLDIVEDALEERVHKWVDATGEQHVESFALLDAAEAQRLKDLYNERAEAVLAYYKHEERKGAPLTTL